MSLKYWGDSPIHPKTLKQYGYECIGNMHKEWATGLSTNTIEKILVEHKVPSREYNYINESINNIQTHTAYKIEESVKAIRLVTSTATQKSQLRWESPHLSSRFQLLKKVTA